MKLSTRVYIFQQRSERKTLGIFSYSYVVVSLVIGISIFFKERGKMTFNSKVLTHDAPLKLMVQDVRNVTVNKSHEYPWKIQIPADTLTIHTVIIEFIQIWLQGSIKNCGDEGENILVTDGSGDVKVTKCSRVPGDRSWMKPGAYCGVLACIKLPTKSPPEVEAIKLMHISEGKNEAECMWPLEVQELKDFLRGNITFDM